MDNSQKITSKEQLRALYSAPMPMAVKKQQDSLDTYAKQFLQLCPFITLSTVGQSGFLDCSPRGDHPGFIQSIGNQSIAIPDRPGNNRLDSLTNIVECSEVGVLALIPGFKECLRINGEAYIDVTPGLLKRFEYRNKLPTSVIVVNVREVYFHCAKAITRSHLWDSESYVDRSEMPSFGRILMEQIKGDVSDEDVEKAETLIAERVKTTLY
ncbi:hypothetical protein A9Q99_17710 [Gammaproteobacteria bacterium 45_16_T64]|nr:hypothetical protein A9Q99_17710 [Gammaproteobacteria bacterium 45_16_T64]